MAADIYNAEVVDLGSSTVISDINATPTSTYDNKVLVLNSTKTLAGDITKTLVTIKIVRGGKLQIDADRTIACNIIVDSGGLIAIAAGKKLTVNGVLEAGLYKIFDLLNITDNLSEVIGKPKVNAVYPVWFGAVGDYSGGSGTDNLPFFNAALKLIDSSAGGTISLPNLNENNDYRISDNWNLTKSNTTLFIDKGVTIRTTAATTAGHTLAFTGQSGANIENVSIIGGGTVRNDKNLLNGVENAIGFSYVNGFQCIGMRVPECSRKGITAQGDCKNGIISDNIIGDTGIKLHGITVELAGTENIVISNNVIKNTDENGIHIYGGYDYKKISIINNLIENPKKIGIYVGGNYDPDATPTPKLGINFFLISDNRLVYPETSPDGLDGAEGIWVYAARKVSIRNNFIYKSRKEGIRIEKSAEVSVIDNFLEKPSFGNDNTYDAIRSLGSYNKSFFIAANVIKKDSSYGYKNTIRMDSGERPIININRFDTGDTDLISGYLPKVYFDSYVDGDTYSTNFKSSDFDGRRLEQNKTYASSVDIDHSQGSSVYINNITGSLTINSITNGEAGDTILIRITNTSGSAQTLAYGTTGFRGPTGGPGSLPTGKTRFLGLINIAGTWNEYINYEYSA